MVKTNCFTHILEASTQKHTMWYTELFRIARACACAQSRACAPARARTIKCACRDSHLNLKQSMVNTNCFTGILESPT
eukprot:2514339-Pyramimonas_sp.AAC.1